MINLYREELSLRESIRDDLLNHECFFDDGAFSKLYDIDGRKIRGILVQSKTFREQLGTYEDSSGLIIRNGLSFICRCEDVEDVKANHTIMIDGHVYMIQEARKVQDLYWKIELTIAE